MFYVGVPARGNFITNARMQWWCWGGDALSCPWAPRQIHAGLVGYSAAEKKSNLWLVVSAEDPWYYCSFRGPRSLRCHFSDFVGTWSIVWLKRRWSAASPPSFTAAAAMKITTTTATNGMGCCSPQLGCRSLLRCPPQIDHSCLFRHRPPPNQVPPLTHDYLVMVDF